MSEQEKPDPFPLNPVFNVVNWLQPPNLAGTIDVAYLDSHYLRFPLAQGLQTLLDVNVNGTANFYSNAIFNSDASFNQDVDIAGTLTAGTFSIGNLTVNSADVGFGGIDCSGNLLVVDYTGSEQDTEMVVFSNVTTTGKLGIVMNPRPANYNPIVRGDDTIMSFGQNNGAIANFCIAPWSLTACGLRVTKTDLLLGAGGTTTIGSPIDPTQRIYIDGSANRIAITTNNLQVNGSMDMVASTGANRAIFSTYYNLKTGDTNTAIGAIYAIGSNFFYANNANSGNHIFYVHDALGVQTTPLQLTSTSVQCNENILINGIGNYLQFPDGTQQTTAYTGGTSGTYSISYTTNQTITIPNNCRSIDVYVCGAGGLAGAPNGAIYGGMGSGGNSIWACGIPMNSGEQLQLVFATGSGNATRINYLTFPFAVAYNGLNGQDASAGGAGGQPNFAQASSGDTTFGTWTSAQGSAGSNGGTTTLPILNQKTACPKGISSWSATKNGCGQRETTTALASGVIIITYDIYT